MTLHSKVILIYNFWDLASVVWQNFCWGSFFIAYLFCSYNLCIRILMAFQDHSGATPKILKGHYRSTMQFYCQKKILKTADPSEVKRFSSLVLCVDSGSSPHLELRPWRWARHPHLFLTFGWKSSFSKSAQKTSKNRENRKTKTTFTLTTFKTDKIKWS